MAGNNAHLFLDEGIDELGRILCTTVEDLDGTYPEHVLLSFQVCRSLYPRREEDST
jgi:hypothetical protein